MRNPIRTTFALTVFAILALAPAALALTKPSASTGSAHQVTDVSAMVNGSVNPNGSETSYYVQYGPTRAYGLQTPTVAAGAGTHALNVSVALAGLLPLTQYHYRFVAVNAAGVSDGSDASFVTKKVPLAFAFTASPNPVPFGGAITITGTLSGTGNVGRIVDLQANSFPFTTGFQNIGNPEITSASGGFSFPLLGLTLITQFRIVAPGPPAVISAVGVEGVAVRVVSHLGRTGHAHLLRIFGTVTPAVDGAHVAILRLVRHHKAVLVAGTVLRHRNATSSKFSRVVRVHRGTYRVLVRVTNGAWVSDYGGPLRVG